MRKKLSDILRGGAGSGASWIGGNWGNIPPAPDYGTPVPRNWYVAHVIDGALFNAQTGTPGYKVTFEIIEGDYKGRRLWLDIWLTDTAKRGAVRDLAKLGIQNQEQLEQPLEPYRIRCRVLAVVHRDNQGIERNAVKSFEVIGVDPPPPRDAFAPADEPKGGPQQ
jgi:hypothetical protein